MPSKIKGSTSQSIEVLIRHGASSATPGAPMTGLAHNTSGLVCWYKRGDTGTLTQLSLASLTNHNDAWEEGGFKEINATTFAGRYRLCVSDAMVAVGADDLAICLSGATDMDPCHVAVELLDEVELTGTSINAQVKALDANTVTATVVADDTITAAKIAANAITSSELADGAITAAKLATGAITAAKFAASAIDAAALATDAVTEIQSGLATAAALNTVDDFLDTEIAAIKAKTDQLTFTVANQVDANIQSINDTAIVGNGASPKFGV